MDYLADNEPNQIRMRHPAEIFAKFMELGLPLEKFAWFLGTIFAYGRDYQLLELLKEEKEGNDVFIER